MYDKVKMFLVKTSATPDISKYIDAGREINLSTGEVKIFGSLEGLKVSVYTGGISIVGSLSKYFYPNNIYPLDVKTTRAAIEKLSDSLHMGVDEAKITGLEFGTQFIMRYPPERYFNRLGELKRMKRCLLDSSLYYKQTGRDMVFYDKKAQAKRERMVLPPGFDAANLLKCELRLDKKLPQRLNVPKVKASTLYDREFYRLMVGLLQQHYFSIDKKPQIALNSMEAIKTPNDAYELFLARLIAQGDPSMMQEFIKELKEEQVFSDRKNYNRVKNKLDSLYKKSCIPETDELIRELDDEFRNIGTYV